MKWTNNQKLAIEKSNCNIQVSAGAGSGKTAVLTSRVIRILESGINLNQLLILTFTNDAANEMKNRIRKKLKDNEKLGYQLDYLDAAYITTFDSFALSIVKKYGYIQNISSNVAIINDSILIPLKKRYIDEVLTDLYKEKNELLYKYLDKFTLKDDTDLKLTVLKFLNFLDKKNDKNLYINKYMDLYYSDNHINECIDDYCKYIFELISKLKNVIKSYNLLDEEYQYLMDVLVPLFEVNDYDQIKRIDIKFKRASNCTESYKECKSIVNDIVKQITSLSSITKEEIKNSIISTKDTAQLILNISKKVYNKIQNFEYINEKYTFSDIASLAYDIINNNKEVKEELTNTFYEIMIDEYQDTNDIQEDFINLIANNNVYCVGDIKQSIYRFRNANPELFKKKYELYSENIGGIKIDLVENFRSRKEVLKAINNIFNNIMFLNQGGANYKENHQMKFGNPNFEQHKNEQLYGLKVLNYNTESNKEITEAFIVGYKIKELIDSKYQILDDNKLRNIKYSDITILMDRSSSFNTYKKVFENLDIPLVLNCDENLTVENDILVLKNIIGLIIKVKNQQFDEDFKHYYVSISRSFIINDNDNKILNDIKNNLYIESELYTKIKEICNNISDYNCKSLLELIVDKFNFYENLISIGKIEESIIRIDKMYEIADDLNNLGLSIEEFFEILDQIINDKNQEIKYSLNINSSNSVSITNIHKSKGLEYSVCFFTGYYKKFNKQDIKDMYLFSNKYGMILPYYNNGIGNTILRDLYIKNYNEEDISERIRLLYVALTRCKELMFIVCPINDKKIVNFNSFLDIITLVKDNISEYIETIDLSNYNIVDDIEIQNKNYLDYIDNSDILIDKQIVNLNYNIINEEHASKTIKEIVTKEENEIMKYGTYIHELFEISDFKSSDNKILKSFVEKIGNINNAKIIKEHEFIYEKDNTVYHGIIDLILEYDNCIKIIDYKLKNIEDINYIKQLNIYKNYINSISNKEIHIYLYSILENELVEIKTN